MQVTDGNRWQRISEWIVFIWPSVGRRLRRKKVHLIEHTGQIRIRPQIRCDLLGARLVDPDLRRSQSRVPLLKCVTELLPGETVRLRLCAGRRARQKEAANTPAP